MVIKKKPAKKAPTKKDKPCSTTEAPSRQGRSRSGSPSTSGLATSKSASSLVEPSTPGSSSEEVDLLAKFRKVSEVGTSLASEKLPDAPIPSGPIHKAQIVELSDEEVEELKKTPIYDIMQEALHRLGGVNYFIRVGLYDHRTFLGALTKLAPKTLEVGPTSSFIDLVQQACARPLPPRGTPRDITPEVI